MIQVPVLSSHLFALPPDSCFFGRLMICISSCLLEDVFCVFGNGEVKHFYIKMCVIGFSLLVISDLQHLLTNFQYDDCILIQIHHAAFFYCHLKVISSSLFSFNSNNMYLISSPIKLDQVNSED